MSNKLKNILIRADSSATIGTGHIMRDLVLALELQKESPNTKIFFATQNLEGNINKKIVEAGHEIIDLKTNSIDELLKVLEALHVEMIVIDHYQIDWKFEEQLKIQNPKLKIMSLDDTYEKHTCDILLNHNISAKKKKYKGLVPKHCELRCGSEYTLLRDEFLKIKLNKRDIKDKKILTVFISMGGTDNININIQILEKMSNINNLKVIILSTTANKNLNSLKKYVKNKTWIKLYVNSNDVAYLMNNSDFAIVTPSVTVNEVCFMNLPFIIIKTIDNQKDIYDYLKKDFLALNYLEISQLNDIINCLIENYSLYLQKIEEKFYEKR